MGQFSNSLTSELRENQTEMLALEVISKIEKDLKNVIDLKSDAESVLANLEPSLCKGSHSSAQAFSSAIIPFPGKTLANMNSRTSLAAIEPSSTAGLTATNPDVIRYVSKDPHVSTCKLELNASDGNKTYDSSGSNPIVVNATCSLSVGDFFLVSDSQGSGLGRITSSSTCHTSLKCFYKASGGSGSIWNVASMSAYGRDADGAALPEGATIEKVNISTVALDKTLKKLFIDRHQKDDGFIEGTTTSIASGALAKSWEQLGSDIVNFRVNYDVQSDVSATDIITTRTPRAGESGEINGASSTCGNQMGQPYFRNIQLSIETSKKVHKKMVDVTAIFGSEEGSSGTGGSSSTVGPFGAFEWASTGGICVAPCVGVASY